nr:MAG TPA: Neck appendage protein [Caudoviricetes sp.]
MIYLTNGNAPLNAAYADEIVQIDSNTYQLTFRFPTSDSLWEKLKEETFLTADDLHGEQDFVIFEVEKKHGYIQVYANQVFTLLNNYVVNPISLDRQTGSTALSRFASAITRNNPFSFFSDIEDRHTFNIGSKNAMEAFAKDKHSILGQWGGDLVRHGYQVRLLKNGGSENESLFMYKKNLSSYQHKTSTKSLKTRITFKTTVKGEGEKAPDRKFSVVVDSPLINKYSQIYEDVIEVNDEDVKDEASLRKYGEQYFKTSLCDMMEDSLELEVVGQSDVPVQIYDIVSLFYEIYNLDVRKKITKYTYSPMAKKLKSIGFGQFQSGLANAIGNAVSDAVKGEAQQLQDDFERQLARELKNADLAFDRQKEELVNQFTDGLNAAKARAEEVKRELSDTINQRFDSFNNGPLQEAKRRAEEALRNAGASTLLAQEAKRIGLDSVAKLEEFKRQATNAQTALLGDLDVLKRTIANDIRPKQEQVTAEIEKQVKALIQTKNELSGIKSAQATYEETTTRRLAELTNLANGKASKSEVVQTVEELRSRIASVQVGGINLLRNTASLLIGNRSKGYWMSSSGGNGRAISVEVLDPPQKMIKNMIRVIENTNGGNKDLTQLVRLRAGEKYTISCYARVASDSPNANVNLLFRSWANETDLNRKFQKSISHKNWQKYSFTFTADAIENLIQFGQSGPGIIEICAPKIESGTLATDYSENPEDVDDRVSAVESTFKQRADSLEAGVNRLTEGLRTKADISALNVTAENIRQSVKSLETDTQNKLNQKLSTAEFEVRASGIRQEIVNATKDKADKTLVTTEAGKLRTELSTVQAYIDKDSQRQETLRKYSREESARQATAVRELVARDYVGKSTYQEDVRGLERRFSAISTQTNNDIASKIAQYKQTVDGQFANITSQISGKTNQTDFQRVKETSQLYERIIGSNENDISNKVARMALTNQLFQVEVTKASASGRNLFLNSLFKRDLRERYSTYDLFDGKDQTQGQLALSIDTNEKFKGANTLKIVSTFNGKLSNQKATFTIGGDARLGTIDEMRNKSVRFSFWAKSTVNNTNFQARAGYRNTIQGVSLTTDWKFYDIELIRKENSNATSELILHIFTAATVWIAFPKIEIGTVATPFSEAPEDTDEAIRSVQSQLAGSWAVQNLTSAGALVSGLNLGANGHNRLDGKLTHITGETLIDKAVIKSAMVDKLKTANFEAGSVTTVVLDAEAVTAEKLKVDQAFFNKLVANEAYLSQLFAKQAFINRVQSVAIDASQVRSGILSGDRIYGGTIRGANIYGGTLTGHTKIQLGSYGSFDTVNGGLQINVPRDYNAKDGLGVQFIGSYGRGENVPYGLFLYRDSDFTIGNTATDTDEFLMTVQGYINAKGIGWLRTGKGSINGKTAATIGLWDSDNVSLSFGGSGNDIYYSYNGTAYSLWTCVNAHFSDRRLKENIVDCKYKALDYIQQFQFKEYDWKKQADRPRQAHTKIGLIAQEVQKVDSTLVYENGDTLNLDNLRLTNIALKAIQELALENQKLKQRLENLENERRTA